MKGVSIKKYIYDNDQGGVEGLCVFGVPKSGKDNLINRVNYHCMKDNKENAIIPGDIFCEFRNLAIHKDAYTDLELLVPQGYDIYPHLVPDWVWKLKEKGGCRTEVNYSKIDIKEYLEDQNGKLLVVYDGLFDGLLLWKRVQLWNDIGQQLIRRTYDLEKPIILRFSEAGVFFPYVSLKEHWHEVYFFNQMNVDFRKADVRLQLISQLGKEIMNTVREKQYWILCKRGRYVGVDTIPKKLRERLPYYAQDEYAILYGGIYTGGNRNKFLPEAKDKWKMKPLGDVVEYCKEYGLIQSKDTIANVDRDVQITILYLSGNYTQMQLTESFDCSQQRISQIVKETTEKFLKFTNKQVPSIPITN